MEQSMTKSTSINPFRIGGGGGHSASPLSIFLITQNNIFLTFNKVELEIFLPKNQGQKPYLGLSMAFFVIWP